MRRLISRSVIALASISLSLFTLNAKDNDVVVTPELTEHYSVVLLSGDFRAEFRPETDTLKIMMRENIVNLLDCVAANDTLRIKFKDGKGAKAVLSAKAPLIYLPFRPEVKKILLEGTIYLESNIDIKADSLGFKLSGASRLVAPMNVRNLSVFCAGTSNVTMTGYAESLKIRIDGVSRVAACEGFECKNADLDINGSGIVRINCTDRLSGQTSGVSMVRYLNEPKELSVRSNGINGIAKIKN